MFWSSMYVANDLPQADREYSIIYKMTFVKMEKGSGFKARVLFVQLRGPGVGSFVEKLLENRKTVLHKN